MTSRFNIPSRSGPWPLLIGQALIGALFLISGLMKIGRYAGIAAALNAKGLPAPELLTALVIGIEVVGGTALIVNRYAKHGAYALLAFTGIATFLFHAFWLVDASNFQNQLNHFLKNVAIMGGLLMLITIAGETGSRKHKDDV